MRLNLKETEQCKAKEWSQVIIGPRAGVMRKEMTDW